MGLALRWTKTPSDWVSRVTLPPFLEPQRAKIEANLTPID